jgi:hypothetical protein
MGRWPVKLAAERRAQSLLVDVGARDPRESGALPALAQAPRYRRASLHDGRVDEIAQLGAERDAMLRCLHHEDLGLAAAAKTAELVADLVTGRRPTHEYRPWWPNRFR